MGRRPIISKTTLFPNHNKLILLYTHFVRKSSEKYKEIKYFYIKMEKYPGNRRALAHWYNGVVDKGHIGYEFVFSNVENGEIVTEKLPFLLHVLTNGFE